MSFPFGWNPPSLGHIIEVCCRKDNGCELHTLDYEVEGSFGKIKPKLLKRVAEGNELHVVLPNKPDEVLITLAQTANICRRLDLPTTIFGFKFDYETGNITIPEIN